MTEYLALLQSAAVTVVACVLIVGAASDLFAVESTGRREPGDGPFIMSIKHQGALATGFRWMVMLKALFLTWAYTLLLSTVILACTYIPSITPSMLQKYFVLVVSATILSVCWISLFATFIRWRYMRRAHRRVLDAQPA